MAAKNKQEKEYDVPDASLFEQNNPQLKLFARMVIANNPDIPDSDLQDICLTGFAPYVQDRGKEDLIKALGSVRDSIKSLQLAQAQAQAQDKITAYNEENRDDIAKAAQDLDLAKAALAQAEQALSDLKQSACQFLGITDHPSLSVALVTDGQGPRFYVDSDTMKDSDGSHDTYHYHWQDQDTYTYTGVKTIGRDQDPYTAILSTKDNWGSCQCKITHSSLKDPIIVTSEQSQHDAFSQALSQLQESLGLPTGKQVSTPQTFKVRTTPVSEDQD